jgi:hypothetical protein
MALGIDRTAAAFQPWIQREERSGLQTHTPTTALDDMGSKSFLEKITCLPNQMLLFLCEIITTEGLHFFQRFDQLKLLVTVR